MSWRNKRKRTLPQAPILSTPKEVSNADLFQKRWKQRCHCRLLDRVIVLLSRKRLVGNRTLIEELDNLLRVPAAGLSPALGNIPVEAIYAARVGIWDLRADNKIFGKQSCGHLRAVIQRELEEFDAMLNKLVPVISAG